MKFKALHDLRTRICGKGPVMLRGLGRKFRLAGSWDGSNCLSKCDFKKILAECGVELHDKECKVIISHNFIIYLTRHVNKYSGMDNANGILRNS